MTNGLQDYWVVRLLDPFLHHIFILVLMSPPNQKPLELMRFPLRPSEPHCTFFVSRTTGTLDIRLTIKCYQNPPARAEFSQYTIRESIKPFRQQFFDLWQLAQILYRCSTHKNLIFLTFWLVRGHPSLKSPWECLYHVHLPCPCPGEPSGPKNEPK